MTLEQAKNAPIWCNWQLEERNGKTTKIPKIAGTNGTRNAKSNDPSTWRDFFTAQADTTGKTGLFFSAKGNTALCGVDIDSHHGSINELTDDILNIFKGTYSERSPSGNGTHIIFLADLSRLPIVNSKIDARYYIRNNRQELECYIAGTTNRFFTFTGNKISANDDIVDQTDQLLTFLEKYMLKPAAVKREKAAAARAAKTPLTDHAKEKVDGDRECNELDKKKSHKLKPLEIEARWAYALYQDAGLNALYTQGSSSQTEKGQSECDESFCTKAAYYLESNKEAIDYLFRKSALMRDKWDEMRGAQTYGELTIGTSIAYEQSRIDEGGKAFKFNKPRLTVDIIDKLLPLWSLDVKFNEVSRKADCWDAGKSVTFEDFLIKFQSTVGEFFSNTGLDIIQQYLNYCARDRRYNPVVELIDAEPWDGIDRWTDIWRILGLSEATDDCVLSRTLVKKWMYQAPYMLGSTIDKPVQPEGVLVLNGQQGTGKTSFFRRLALKPLWFGEGRRIDPADKDTIIQATDTFITELGEVESTMKSDVSMLKAFILSAVDKYREPYARDESTHPRHTLLAATCNSDRYLIDPTGNRRWFTITLERRIQYSELAEFDFLALWRQAFAEARTAGENCFRLTADEAAALENRNGKHEKPIKGQAEIEDILSQAAQYPAKYIWIDLTASEFKTYFITELRSFSAEQIGNVLKKLKIERKRMTKGRFYSLPIHKDC